VKPVVRDGDNFVFHVSAHEKALLFRILKLYPLVPAAHHQLSRSADPRAIEAEQKLLDEALAEQRQVNQRKIRAMLEETGRFARVEDGYHLTLTGPETEWLLKVLNDIRVGSWIALGEPGPDKGRPAELSGPSALHYAAMEFCGYLQMSLLEVFGESK